MAARLTSNLWKIQAYKFISEFILIVPVTIPFYHHNHLSALQILLVQSVFCAGLLVFEVPSGYFSDVMGRRKTMIIGALMMPVAYLIYSLSSSFWLFCLAELVMAFSFAMRSGTDSAILYDTMQELEHKSQYIHVEGRAVFFERLGTSTSSLLGGALALISIRLPFYTNTVTACLLIALALCLVEPARQTRKAPNPLRDMAKIGAGILKNRELLRVILLFSITLCTGIISIWGYFLYLEKFQLSYLVYGGAFAVFQLIAALGGTQAARLEKWIGKNKALALILIIPFTIILPGLFHHPLLLLLTALHALIWSVSTPLFLDSIHSQVTSDIRATVISAGSMTGRLMFVIVGPLFGLAADHFSIFTALAGLGFLALTGYGLTLLLCRTDHPPAS